MAMVTNTTKRTLRQGVLVQLALALAAILGLTATAGAQPLSDLEAYDMTAATGAGDVVLRADLANPVVLAGAGTRSYLRVGITGASAEDVGRRTPVNVCFVIDRSGSMSGQKLEDAKAAALTGIDRLGEDDIVSIVAYDSTVSVPLPPTRAKNWSDIHRAISSIQSGGNTALFAGVSQGAEQIRRFLDRNQVNRVILMSDGLANVGPSSPGELASLGRSLAREGITVSTVGLGLDYNEDLMAQLAMGGSGFTYFAQESGDLPRIFENELGNVRSVVAQEVTIEIRCKDGVRPIRILGRDGVIEGSDVIVDLTQLYAGFENYVLIEVELPSTEAGATRSVAEVQAVYRDLNTQASDSRSAKVALRGTSSSLEVTARANKEVLVALAEYLSNEQYEMALLLRDKGETDKARQVLQDNASYLRGQAGELEADQLLRLERYNNEAMDQMDEAYWEEGRKLMRQRGYMLEQNNAY